MIPSGTPSWLEVRPHLWIGLSTLLVLFGGFGLWSVTATLSGAVVAPGRVEVAGNRQPLQHPEGGLVAEVFVTEGATVKAGDRVLRLNGTEALSELRVLQSELFELRIRRSRFQAERDERAEMAIPPPLLRQSTQDPTAADQLSEQIRLFLFRRDALMRGITRLGTRMAQGQAHLDAMEAQTASVAKQLTLIHRELADQEALLAKGLARASSVQALRREAARLAGMREELAANRVLTEKRMEEIGLEMEDLRAQRRADATLALQEDAATERELVQREGILLDRIAQLDLRAPVTGSILGLTITTPPAVLRPVDPFAFIVPTDRTLVIAAEIPPLHIDEVLPGQSVRLAFPALPAQMMPEMMGRITVLSADLVVEPRSGRPYYRAEISIDAQAIASMGQRLTPGMPVEAFIQTGARTPFAYLTQPLTKYLSHAFRER